MRKLLTILVIITYLLVGCTKEFKERKTLKVSRPDNKRELNLDLELVGNNSVNIYCSRKNTNQKVEKITIFRKSEYQDQYDMIKDEYEKNYYKDSNLLEGVRYYYQVKNQESISEIKSIKTKLPEIKNLKSDIHNGNIRLSWENIKLVTDNKFLIYRLETEIGNQDKGAKYKLIEKTKSNYFIDKKANLGIKYNYYVVVKNKYGSSGYSNRITAINDISNLYHLNIKDYSSKKISIEIISKDKKKVHNANDLLLYRVRNQSEEFLGEINNNYIDNDVKPGMEYGYFLRTRSNSILGEKTGIISVKTPLGVPRKIRTTLTKNNEVLIEWEKQTKAFGYKIFYREEKQDEKFKLLSDTKKNFVIHKKIKDFTEYAYKLVSYTEDQEGKFSKEFKIKTKIRPPKVSHDQDKLSYTLRWSKIPGVQSYKVYEIQNEQKKFVSEVKGTRLELKASNYGDHYVYKVYALKNGLLGIGSEKKEIGIKLPTPTLEAENGDFLDIILQWYTEIEGVSCLVYRKKIGEKFELIKKIKDHMINYYRDGDLEPETEYFYKVKISNEYLSSEYSNIVNGIPTVGSF